jgi:peptide/nickel transport system substrate-binding protein
MKMSRSKIMMFLAVVIVLSVALAACQPKAAATETTTTGETTTTTTTTTTTATTGRAPEIRFAVLEDMTSQNIWYLWDEGGASTWNYIPQANQWPTLFGLSDQRYDIVVSTAADLPGPFTQEGDYYVNTITLKEGLVWSDGSPVTADDVAFTVNTVLLFQLGLNWQSAYNPDYLVKAEAVDPLTVKYYYNAEPGLALWQYGAMMGPFVSKAFWEPKIADLVAEVTADPNTLADAVTALENLDPTGEPTYGAFKVHTWEVGAYVENTVNENNFFIGTTVQEYANGAYREFNEAKGYDWSAYGTPEGDMTLEYTAGPYFDAAVYTLYDQDTAILALKDNDVDFILNPSGWSLGAIKQLEGDPAITIVTNDQNGFRYLAFNQNRPYFQGAPGIALRQAVACIIDLDFLTGTVLQGQVLPVYTLVPEGNGFWFNPDVTKYCQGMSEADRVAQSVQYMKDAGYTWDSEPYYNSGSSKDAGVIYGEGLKMPDGQYFPDVTLLAPSAGYDPLRATTAIYIESWMRELGIPVTANLTAFNNITDAVYNTGDYDMFILGWGLSIYPDYICTFFNNGDGTDPYGYLSPTLEPLCVQFLLETDLNAAKQEAFQIQNVLATELPYITLFTNPIRDAWRNLTYPYTSILDGISSGLYGGPTIAMPASSNQ